MEQHSHQQFQVTGQLGTPRSDDALSARPALRPEMRSFHAAGPASPSSNGTFAFGDAPLSPSGGGLEDTRDGRLEADDQDSLWQYGDAQAFAPRNALVLRTPATRQHPVEPTGFYTHRETAAAAASEIMAGDRRHPYVYTPAGGGSGGGGGGGGSGGDGGISARARGTPSSSRRALGQVVCFLCGTAFPLSRLAIHQRACRDAFLRNASGATPPGPPEMSLPIRPDDPSAAEDVYKVCEFFFFFFFSFLSTFFF
jgi:hypothetical protein